MKHSAGRRWAATLLWLVACGMGLAADAPTLNIPFIDHRKVVVDRFEKHYLEEMVARHSGNLSRASSAAGLDRSYFKRLLKKHQA